MRLQSRSTSWRVLGLSGFSMLIACTSALSPGAGKGPSGPTDRTDGRRVATQARFESVDFSSGRWFRGNTHTHTLESDGDSPPEVVVTWYRNHGYDFLVMSDHNVWVNPAELSHLVDSAFLLIPGEELTTRFGARPVHVNGLNIPHVIEPRTDTSLLGTIQRNVDAVREVEGVPHINHPNFGWALPQEILAQVRNNRLLEIHNAHPLVHNRGGGDSPGMEAVWDYLLSQGLRIYGIAVDDAPLPRRIRCRSGESWKGVGDGARRDARCARASRADGGRALLCEHRAPNGPTWKKEERI